MIRLRGLLGLTLLVSGVSLCGEALEAHWPQFRGVNSSGVAIDSDPPLRFEEDDNLKWKRSIDPGHSSPCIAGGYLFLTSFDREAETLSVHCLDRNSGVDVWRRDLRVKEFEKGHPSFNPASSSPATDGEVVVVYFGSYGLICYTVTGEKLWEKRLPVTKSFAGNATSPAIYGDKVVLYRANVVDHYLVAYDRLTGREEWKRPQSEPFAIELSCTACPILYQDQLLVHSARSIQSYRLLDGQLNWITKCDTTATTTPVLAEGEVIVAAWNKMGEAELRPPIPDYGTLLKENDADGNGLIGRDEFPKLWVFHRPLGAEAPLNGMSVRFQSTDRNRDNQIDEGEWEGALKYVESMRAGYETHGLLGIDLESRGVLHDDQVRLLLERGIPEVPSPVYIDGYVYLIKNGGLLTCVDVARGRRVYLERTQGKGTHYASPIIAGNRLYCFSGQGQISVLSLGEDPELLGVSDLAEPIYATPAVVARTMYIRSHDHLFAFERK